MKDIGQLDLISKSLSKLMGIELTLDFRDHNSKPTGTKYTIFLGEDPCFIFTEEGDLLSEREQALIEYLLSEIIGDSHKTKPREELLKKITTGELSKTEREDIISKLNINSNDLATVVIIKALKESLYEEIHSLISNIDLNIIGTIQLDNKSTCIIFYGNNLEYIKSMCEAISYTIESELLELAKIGVGTTKPILDINRSYKEARIALDIGNRYKLVTSIYYYKDFLIYNLISSIELDKMEDLYNQSINMRFNELSIEDIKTANTLIKNDLKLNQTAKVLYIHRNTLLYRIERLNKITGLDLRCLNDAMEFKILLIVYKSYKYMD